MVAVKEFSWEEVAAPDFGNPARAAWREAVAAIAVKAKDTLPECNGRVDAAVKIVLAGDVALLPEGKARVASQSNGTTQYVVCNGTCECKDFPKAPSGWCKHRIAAGLYKRATALAKAKLDAPATDKAAPAEPPTPVQPEAPIAPLPEAPASINVHLELAGRQVQLTLRDSDETRLLARLAAVLAQFPLAEKPQDTTPQCPTHGAMKPSTKGKGWYCPIKLADGSWCKGK